MGKGKITIREDGETRVHGGQESKIEKREVV